MRVDAAQRELLRRFAALDYPAASFRHAEHLELAWTLLAERPLLSAMQEFRRLLQAFAARWRLDSIVPDGASCAASASSRGTGVPGKRSEPATRYVSGAGSAATAPSTATRNPRLDRTSSPVGDTSTMR